LLRVAIDSNIFFSAFTKPGGAASQLLRLAEEQKFRLGVPKYSILELEQVFVDKKLEDAYMELVQWVKDNAEEIVLPRGKILNRYKDYAIDIWDIPVIASAIEWNADYFITGNIIHFAKEKVEQHLKMFTIRDFLKMFEDI